VVQESNRCWAHPLEIRQAKHGQAHWDQDGLPFPAAHRGAMIRGPMSHTLWIFPSARPGQGYALREKRLRANPKPPSRPARQTRYEGSGTVENEVKVATFPFAGPLTVSNASAN
jgi:hypothetical protein